MKLNRTQIGWSVAALAFAGALAWAFRPQPVPVEVARAARGAVRVTVDAEGRTRLKERYVVAAPLAGRLLRVELKPGDAVEADRTVLAALEPSDPELLDPRARLLAEARVKAAEAAWERTESERAQARTTFEYARTALERAQRLFAERTLSHQELDAAEERERTAAERLRAAEFAAKIALFELEQARAALGNGRAADGAARFEIRAPISGRVLRVFQESATVVGPGARLIELGDPAELEIEIEALSSDAVKVTPGAMVLLEHWGGDEPLTARVRLVEPSAFTKISALGVEEQHVFIIADFTGARALRAHVGDGYRVEARVVVAEVDDVLTVPTGALFREGGEWAVFSIEHDRAVLRRVELGYRNDLVAEIRSGLAADASVVVHPSDRVGAGTRVQIRK